MRRWMILALCTAAIFGMAASLIDASTAFADGNRLTYLDENNPWYPHTGFPKLTTPQWVGEEGVQAVVIIAIDDMRDTKKYEDFLRPILNRLKQIDGRAPVSIMTCSVDPQDEQLQKWLAEGLSIECHTVDHPCPLLQGGDFKKAKSTYDRCIDLLNEIPNTKPVAFRMPCCDSLNTVSPRFYAEIFNTATEKGNFLQIDSSVFNFYTSADPEIPRELVTDPDGKQRFMKYVPKNLKRGDKLFNTFVNTIENYPYPYVINRTCWEFPCMAPSDWSAQHYHGVNNPQTVADWKAALDITVQKQGVFTMVFHPHGWIKNTQIVDLIDHAVQKHGKKVKFLTFQEALRRLNDNLLDGNPLRAGAFDNGVRLLDADNDGYMDVLLPSAIDSRRRTLGHGNLRMWLPENRGWKALDVSFPLVALGANRWEPLGARFGFLKGTRKPSLLVYDSSDGRQDTHQLAGFRHFTGNKWIHDDAMLSSLKTGGDIPLPDHCDGVRFHDLNRDGISELIVGHPKFPAIYGLAKTRTDWERLPFGLPEGTSIVNDQGHDAGLRFVDINEDGFDDVVFSNPERYGIWLFKDMQSGWSIEVLAGERDTNVGDSLRESQTTRGADHPAGGARPHLPPIVRADGSDNGFFVHSRHLFWQNEDTADLPDLVDRRSFDELLKGVRPTPKSPEMSLRSMVPRPGFQVELMAAEPLVKDPVAFEWGPDGKLWVVEMADYPVGVPNASESVPDAPSVRDAVPGGRIRYLEDTDGDGQFDNSTVFLDGLNFPNGVLPWRNGLLVTAAPDIIYAEDTDGDGRADKREVLFTGFGQGNQQHRVNGLVYGLDNWVYCANGNSDGVVKSLKTGETVDVRGRDFRIRPDTGDIDLQTGSTQFGRNRDDWGNWFGCNNSNPMWHFVLADQYLRRNPHLSPPNSRVDVPEVPGAAPVYPVSRPLPRFNDPEKLNRFTSACSAIVYRDNRFGPDFAGNMFVSEPVHNLVHREIMEPNGVTFRSRRADDEWESEFLASRDNWFRPTTIKTGPDGALWIADMYRYVIEHTQYIPKELQKGLPVRAGEDRGRLYRVYLVDQKPRPIPNLAKMTTAELVAALDSPNGWQRDTAQRLLVERGDRSAVPMLEHVVRSGSQNDTGPRGRGDAEKESLNSGVLARLQALCTLEGLGALTPEILQTALTDPHPGVRRHAIRLSEPLLNDHLQLAEAVVKRVDDPDPHVQMQLAYTLGEWDDPRAGQALANVAVKHADDDYILTAVLSSVTEHNVHQLLAAVVSRRQEAERSPRLLQKLFSVATAVGGEPALKTVFSTLTSPEGGLSARWRFESLADVLDVLRRQQSRTDGPPSVRGRSHAEERNYVRLDRLSAVFEVARSVAADDEADPAHRAAAIRLLGREERSRQADVGRLAGLLRPQTPASVQSAAVERLGDFDSETIPALLLSGWKTHSPSLRDRILSVLLRRPAGRKRLLDGLESGTIRPAEIDAAQRQRLLQSGDADVRKRAEQLFADVIDADRQNIVQQYRTALARHGNPGRGKELFAKHCAQCHRLEGVGYETGADLLGLNDKSPDSLLIALLDPNRAVESKFVDYVAVTKDGRTLNGILADESGNSLTLLGPKGEKQVVLRADLEALTSTAKSLMPEGLEKDLTPDDVADVIAYLRDVGRKDEARADLGSFPRTIRPQGDGSLELSASKCEIYGPNLVLEKKYGNLGYWQSEADRAIWPMYLPHTGTYELRVQWACDDGSAGNAILFECGTSRLTAKVPGTKDWDTYREKPFGRMTLPAGQQRFIARSAGPVRGALIDLKLIRLVPVERP